MNAVQFPCCLFEGFCFFNFRTYINYQRQLLAWVFLICEQNQFRLRAFFSIQEHLFFLHLQFHDISSIYTYDKCSILLETIRLWNHTSHTKVYSNEFVANVLRDKIGIVVIDLWGYGGCQRPKTLIWPHTMVLASPLTKNSNK